MRILSLVAGSVAGSQTWNDVMVSGSVAILHSIALSGYDSTLAAGSGSPSAVGSG